MCDREGPDAERLQLVFVFPRVLKELYYEGCDYHLGAAYIRAYLAERGIRTSQYLDNGSLSISATAVAIIAGRPLAVGFSCYDANFYFVKLLAQEIRQICPSIAILCGGPTATFSSEEIMKDCPSVDLVVRGYGEETTLDIIEALKSGGDLRKIAGVSFRDPSGGITSTANRILESGRVELGDAAGPAGQPSARRPSHQTSLDRYPDPYLAGFLPPERAGDIGIVTSRGCSFPCTFCNFAAMSQRKTTYQSTETAMAVFEHLNKVFSDAGEKQLVTINDDNFSMHSRRLHELLRLMAARKFENIEFWAEMRVEPLESETFDLLQQAGFREINFGLESAVPSILAQSKKVRPGGWERDGYDKERRYVEKIAQAVSELKRRGIKTCVSVILGLPGEIAENGLQTLRFVESLSVDKYAHNFITVRLGTELADTYQNFGIRVRSLPGRLLPLVTEAAYDVERLEILPNDDSQLPIRGILLQDAAVLTSGTGLFVGRVRRPKDHGRGGAGVAKFDAEDGIPPLFAIDALERDVVPLAAWLAKEKPMGSPIWLVGLSETDRTRFEQGAASEGVACLEGNILQPVPDSEAWEIGGRISPIHSKQVLLAEIAINSVNANAAPLHNGSSSLAAQVKLRNPHDLTRLRRAFEVEKPSGRAAWVIRASTIENGLSIEDGCRWSGQTCPAVGGLKYLIREKQILTCNSGTPIGQVGEPLEKYQSRVRSELEMVRVRRGCQTCVARKRCSQCIHTGPFTESEFCTVQKEGWRISTLMDVLTLLRGLSSSGAIEVDGEDFFAIDVTDLRDSSDMGGGIDELIYVRGSGSEKAFLYSAAAQELFGCPADQRVVFDVLSGVHELIAQRETTAMTELAECAGVDA